jgi:hypothetical protein
MTSESASLDTRRVLTHSRLLPDVATLDRLVPWAIAAVVIATLWFVHRDFPVGIAQDDGLYVILAKALATGQGLRFINLPGAPAGVHYPPGYPSFLAVLWHFASTFDARLHLFAMANIALLGAAAAGTFLLARRAGMARRGAAICALAGFLMPPALWMGTALLSEPLWLALGIPWLLWAEAAVDDPRSTRPRTWIGLGLTAGMIALVRTQSTTLVMGLAAILVIRRQWKPALIVLAAVAVMLLPWQLWVAHQSQVPPVLATKYGVYGAWLSDAFRAQGMRLLSATLARNIVSVGAILGSMFGPAGASWIGVVLLIAPMIAGLRRLARRAPVTLVMMLAHGAIIVALPFEPRRYVWTSWPFVVLWIAAGIAELHAYVAAVGRASRVRGESAPRFVRAMVRLDTSLLIAGAALTTGVMAWTGAYRGIAEGQARRIVATVEWVRGHAAPGALVATEDETAVYLYTGRRALPTTSVTAVSYARSDAPTPSVLDAVVEQYHPDLAIVAWKTSVEAAERLASGPRPVLRAIDLAGTSVVFQRIQ